MGFAYILLADKCDTINQPGAFLCKQKTREISIRTNCLYKTLLAFEVDLDCFSLDGKNLLLCLFAAPLSAEFNAINTKVLNK